MKIIDIHTHVFPDEIAAKTVNVLAEGADAEAFLNGTVSALKTSMEIAGIDISVNQPISTNPSQVQSINSWAREIEDDGIISFGTLHPLFEDFDDEIWRMKKFGIKGV